MKQIKGLSLSFKSILQAMPHHPSEIFWQRCLSISSRFCGAVVSAGYLSWEQMVSASCRYCLGCSNLGGVIFWQMDQEGRIHDGKVMYYRSDCHRDKDRHPTWVSSLIRRRDPFPNARHETSHCLFGLHLLVEGGRWRVEGEYSAVAVVEAEKTAVIMSELCPQYIWLAAGGLWALQPDLFRPLQGRKVILFPDTDEDGTAFRQWYGIAQTVMALPFWENSPPIRVSPILELKASPAQKSAKIDLIDYMFNSERN